ncbi:MAG: ABC-type branched-chain amino acid transport system, ATPase component [Conexibacter sp.]|nr:ABC-type branched-chain amino acid transport system, ATPase component [Conexibacter sp.]
MSSYILFLLLGLGSGAVYAMLALGLVLKHRAAGVVDFGHGAVAMFIAYVYLGLRADGTLQFPWIVIPHELTLRSSGLATIPAMVVALVYAAILGVVMYWTIYRPLRHATPLTRVCASVGTMLALQAIAVLNYGTTAKSTPTILPSSPLKIGDITIPSDRLWLAGIVILLAAALGAVYRYTRFGLATRASAENERGAALVGLSATRIALGNWVLATLLAGLAGILIAPISTVDPTSYTLFIVPALGCALIARFTSFGVAAAAGLALGMLQSEITKLLSVWSWLPEQGLPQAIPFLFIVVAMTMLSRGVGARGGTVELQNPSLGRPSRPYATTLLCFVAGIVILMALHGSLRTAFIASLVWIVLSLSLTVLTGYVGQVSLAQMSFAGLSGFVLSHLTAGAGLPFILALPLASLAAVPLGLLIGLPALRLRGVNLAVVTLAAAFALDALVFNSTWFGGGLAGRAIPTPKLFGWDLGIAKGDTYPRVIFGVVVLLFTCGAGLLVARLRTAPAGRMMIAVRSNERAAAAAGIDVARTKLLAFGLSAFIAGLGGTLFAYQQQNISPPSFAVFTSLSLLAVTYVAGVGRIAGAVVAGIMLSSTGLFVTAADKWFGVGEYQALVAGVALTLTAIKQPDGIAASPPPPLVALGKKLSGVWAGRRNGDTAPPAATPVGGVVER